MSHLEPLDLEFEIMNWLAVFVNSIPPMHLDTFKAADESSLDHYHKTLGPWIRDHLLAESRPLYQTFHRHGIYERDAMSMVIMKAFHRQLQ